MWDSGRPPPGAAVAPALPDSPTEPPPFFLLLASAHLPSKLARLHLPVCADRAGTNLGEEKQI